MKTEITTLLIFFITFSGCRQQKEIELPSKEGISISSSWIRPGVANRNTAVFMIISNNSEFKDSLFSASSSLAKVVEIHETFTRGNDLKGMRQVDYVAIPENSRIELKPNGLHIMLIGLQKNLTSGDTGQITLNFKNAGSIKINAEVK